MVGSPRTFERENETQPPSPARVGQRAAFALSASRRTPDRESVTPCPSQTNPSPSQLGHAGSMMGLQLLQCSTVIPNCSAMSTMSWLTTARPCEAACAGLVASGCGTRLRAGEHNEPRWPRSVARPSALAYVGWGCVAAGEVAEPA